MKGDEYRVLINLHKAIIYKLEGASFTYYQYEELLENVTEISTRLRNKAVSDQKMLDRARDRKNEF